MLAIAGNLRLGARETRRAYLGSTPVFAAEQTRWGTNFGEYATGSPPRDWTSVATSHLETWEITSGGLISANRMRIRQSQPANALTYAYFLWDVLPKVENSEILLLVSRGASNNFNHLLGAGQRLDIVSDSENTGLFLGTRNNTADITRRRLQNGWLHDQVNTAHGGSYGAGDAFWMRCRWDGTRCRMKGWMADTGAPDLGLSNEPSSWQLDDTFATITGAGKTGVVYGSYRTTAAESETFVHYFGVGIDGDSAPMPVLAPALDPGPSPEPGPEPDPDPAPGPAPDPDAFGTFDSTATSFDSTAHTFDEVA